MRLFCYDKTKILCKIISNKFVLKCVDDFFVFFLLFSKGMLVQKACDSVVICSLLSCHVVFVVAYLYACCCLCQ